MQDVMTWSMCNRYSLALTHMLSLERFYEIGVDERVRTDFHLWEQSLALLILASGPLQPFDRKLNRRVVAELSKNQKAGGLVHASQVNSRVLISTDDLPPLYIR